MLKGCILCAQMCKKSNVQVNKQAETHATTLGLDMIK